MALATSIKTLFASPEMIGKIVKIQGWVRTRRDSKAGISFMAVSDGSCFHPIQAVIPNTLSNYDNDVLNANTGCAVIVEGKLVASEGKGQSVEIQATGIEVVGFVEDPATYPMAAKRHSLEHLRDYTQLRVRTNIISAVSRVRHGIARAIHRFFDEHGFF